MQIARRGILVALLTSVPLAAASLQQTSRPGAFTVEQILGFPSPENLVASPVGSTIAWTFNERGVRNIYVAEARSFEPRRAHAVSRRRWAGADATVVFARRQDDRLRARRRSRIEPARPTHRPIRPAARCSRRSRSGRCRSPAARRALRRRRRRTRRSRPTATRVAFVRNRRIWSRRSTDPSRPQQAFFARGTSESPAWSPDGRTLAFVSNRGDHSFIGLFTAGQPIRYLAPSTSRDSMPAWSPDGKRIAFLRQPGAGGAPAIAAGAGRAAAVVDPGRRRADLRDRRPIRRGHGGHERRRARRSDPAEPGRHRPAMGRRRHAASSCRIGTAGRTSTRFSIPGAGAQPTLLTPGRSWSSRSR